MALTCGGTARLDCYCAGDECRCGGEMCPGCAECCSDPEGDEWPEWNVPLVDDEEDLEF